VGRQGDQEFGDRSPQPIMEPVSPAKDGDEQRGIGQPKTHRFFVP
jgi:hypothetical protein